MIRSAVSSTFRRLFAIPLLVGMLHLLVCSVQAGWINPSVTIEFVPPGPGDSMTKTVTETGGDQQITLTIRRVGGAGQESHVRYMTVAGTATAPSDFTAIADTQTAANGVQWAGNETEKTITVTIKGDTDGESTEQFTVILIEDNVEEDTSPTDPNGHWDRSPGGGTINQSRKTVTVEIQDDDNCNPTIGISNATAANATEGGAEISVVVQRTGCTSTAITASLAATLSNSTQADFRLNDSAVSSVSCDMGSGVTERTVTFKALNDSLYEGDLTEMVTLSLTGVTGATSSGATKQITIVDAQSKPTVTVSATNPQVGESAGTSTFRASANVAAERQYTVNFSYTNGTGTAGTTVLRGTAGGSNDYNSPDSAPMPAAATQADVTITVHPDTVVEYNERFKVKATSASAYNVVPANEAEVRILDDDQATVSMSLLCVNMQENAIAGPTGSLTIAKSDLQVTVTPTTSGVTVSPSPVVLAPGTTTQGFVINLPAGDTLAEPDQPASVSFAAQNALFPPPNSCSFTIIDDDLPPIALAPVAGTEVEEDGQALVFRATATGQKSNPFSITLSRAGSSAIEGVDYTISATGLSGNTLQFPATGGYRDITITPLADGIFENPETVVLQLSSTGTATAGSPSLAGATIIDLTAPPTVSLSDATASENDGEALVQWTLSGPNARTGSAFAYSTADGTAVSVQDYTAANVISVLLPTDGNGPSPTTSGTFSVAIADDNLHEPADEQFTAALESATHVAMGVADTSTISIVDNGDSPFSVDGVSVQIDPGTSVRLSAPTSAEISGPANLAHVWTESPDTENGSLATGESTSVNPMWTDAAQTSAQVGSVSSLAVEITDTQNQNQVQSDTLDVAAVPWSFTAEFGGLANLNQYGATPAGEELGYRWKGHSSAGPADEPLVVFGRQHVGNGTFETFMRFGDDPATEVGADEQFLALGSTVGEDGRTRYYLATNTGTAIRMRARVDDDAGWTASQDVQLEIACEASAEIVQHGGFVLLAFRSCGDDAIVTAAIPEAYHPEAAPGPERFEWDEAIVAAVATSDFPAMTVSRGGHLYLASFDTNSGDTIIVRQFVGGAALWNSTPFATISGVDHEPHALDMCTDAWGNLWVASAGADDMKVWISAVDPADASASGVADIGNFANFNDTASGEIPLFRTPAAGGFMAADQSGWVCFVGADANTRQMNLVRAEAVDRDGGPAHSKEVVVREDAGSPLDSPRIALTNRSIPGREDRRGFVHFDAEGAAFISWQPASLLDDTTFQLVGRTWNNTISIENGSPFALETNLALELGLHDPDGVEFAFVETESDIVSATLDGAVLDIAESHPFPVGDLRIAISAEPHGWAGDAGLKAVVGQSVVGERELWPVRDIVVYANAFDATVKSIQITDGTPPYPVLVGDQVLSPNSGPWQLDAKFAYEPDLPFGLTRDDLEWQVFGSIGSITDSALYTPAGLGSGIVRATLPNTNVKDNVVVVLGLPGQLAMYDIRPSGDIVLGLGQEVQLTAVPMDARRNPISGGMPFWSVAGDGTISQNGLFRAPSTKPAEMAMVTVRDQEVQAAFGTKAILIDSDPPHIANFAAAGSVVNVDGSLGGTLTFTWQIADIPREISRPATFELVADDAESYPLSEKATEGLPDGQQDGRSFHHSMPAASFADGEHAFRLVATDRLGNSNRENAPRIVVTISGGAAVPSTALGMDWLLRHQYRGSDAAHFGSWYDPSTLGRGRNELALEASAALEILAAWNQAYRPVAESGENLYTGKRVAVAQASHDAAVWLVRRMRNGEIPTFAARARAAAALATAYERGVEIAELRGGVETDFRLARSMADSFVDAELLDRSFLHSLNPGRLFEHEARLTRFDAACALRALDATGRADALEEVLNVEKGSQTDLFEFLALDLRRATGGSYGLNSTETVNSEGWANDRLRQAAGYFLDGSQEPDNLFLTGEVASSILGLERRHARSPLFALVSDGSVFDSIAELQSNDQESAGSFPAGAPSVADTAASAEAVVRHSIDAIERARAEAGGKSPVPAKANPGVQIAGSSTTWLLREQLAEGDWNARAWDTARALAAVRAELVLGDVSYDYARRVFTVHVLNVGASTAASTRLSLFSEDPARLTPSARVAKRVAYSAAQPVAVSLTTSKATVFEIPYDPSAYPPDLWIMADGENAVAEYHKDNNVARWSLPEGPNLRVMPDSVAGYGASGGGFAVARQAWTLAFDLANAGRQPLSISGTQLVSFYDGDPNSLDEPAPIWSIGMSALSVGSADGKSLRSLASGQVVRVYASIPSGSIMSPGDHDIHVWVDYNSGFKASIGRIAETDETDNVQNGIVNFVPAGTSSLLPDLVVSASAIRHQPVQPNCYETVVVSGVVQNVGRETSAPFILALTREGPLSVPHELAMPAIPPGRRAAFEYSVSAGPGSASGGATFALVADPDDDVVETDENNNAAVHVVPVICTPPPGFLDVAVLSDGIGIERIGDGNYPSFVVSNMAQSFAGRHLGATVMFRSYKTRNKPPASFSEYGAFDLPNFALPRDHWTTISPNPATQQWLALDNGWVDIEVRLDDEVSDPAPGWDGNEANDIARKTLFVGPTDLHVSGLAITPPSVSSNICQNGIAGVLADIEVRVSNGTPAANAGLMTADGVQVELSIVETGEVLDGWSGLVLTPAAGGSNGTVSGTMVLTAKGIELPYGAYTVAARIDPDDTFVELDETNNERMANVSYSTTVDRTGIEPDLALSDVYYVDESALDSDGEVVIYGTLTYKMPSEGCPPLPVPQATIAVTDPVGGALAGAESLLVSNLWPGAVVPFALNTGASLADLAGVSSITIAVSYDPQAGGPPAETNLDDNDETVDLEEVLHWSDCGTAFSWTALASRVFFDWNAPGVDEDDTGTTAVGSYIVVRIIDGQADRSWQLPATATNWIDEQAPLAEDPVYRFYPVGTNGRIGPYCQVEPVSGGEAPRIAYVMDGLDILADEDPEPPATSAIDSELNPARLDMKNNAGVAWVKFPPVGTPSLRLNGVEQSQSVRGTVDFGGETYAEYQLAIPATGIYHSLVAVTTISVSGSPFEISSNRVVMHRDNLLDLAVMPDAEGNPISISVNTSANFYGGEWRTIPVHQFDAFKSKPFIMSVRVENLHNKSLTVVPFATRFAIEYTDGTFEERLVPTLTLPTAGATVGMQQNQAILANPAKKIEKFRVHVDYVNGRETGNIAEQFEDNNIAIVPFLPSDRPLGTEFVAQLPYAYHIVHKQVKTGPWEWENVAENRGIDYRFSIVASKESNAPTTVAVYNIKPVLLEHRNAQGEVVRIDFIRSEDEFLESRTLAPGTRWDWIYPKDREVRTRPSVGLFDYAPDENWAGTEEWQEDTGWNFERSIRIVASTEKEGGEPNPISVMMWDPTPGYENSTLLIPKNQLDSRYTITGHYPSQISYSQPVDSEYNEHDYYGKYPGWWWKKTNFQYFSITALENFTVARVYRNRLGVPAPGAVAPFLPTGPGYYDVYLWPGMTYTWAPHSHVWWNGRIDDAYTESVYQDPTGIRIEADHPVIVGSGLNGGMPSIHSTHGDHTYEVQNPGGIRGYEFYVPELDIARYSYFATVPNPNSSTDEDFARVTTSLVRIVPTVYSNAAGSNITEIRIDGESQPFLVAPDQYLEITPLNPFMHHPDHVWKSSYSAALREPDSAGGNRVVWRRLVESETCHLITANNPCVVTQYFVSAINQPPFGGECRTCHYKGEFDSQVWDPEAFNNDKHAGGDPEFIPILPKRAYTIDSYIPVTMPGGSYVDRNRDRGFNPANPEYTGNKGPSNFLVLVVGYDEQLKDKFATPEVYYKFAKESDSSFRRVDVDMPDKSVVRYPKKPGYPDEWQTKPAPGWVEHGLPSGKSTGYKQIVLKVHVMDESQRDIVIWNKHNLPMMVMSAGYHMPITESSRLALGNTHPADADAASWRISQGSSYGHQNAYRYVSIKDEILPEGVDVAVFSAGIRFPYTDERVVAGEEIPFIVEVKNLGMQPVLNGEATLTVRRVDMVDGERVEEFVLSQALELPPSGDPPVVDPEGVVLAARGGRRAVGWLSDAAGNSDTVIYDPDFKFVPNDNTVGLEVEISYACQQPGCDVDDGDASNNVAERTVEFARPNIFPKVVAYRHRTQASPEVWTDWLPFPKALVSLPEAAGSSMEVRVASYSEMLFDEPFDVRLQSTYGGTGVSPTAVVRRGSFVANQTASMNGKTYYAMTHEVALPFPKKGTYTLKAMVDSKLEIAETIETDNESALTFQVDLPGTRDLQVTGIHFTDTNDQPVQQPFAVGVPLRAHALVKVLKGNFPSFPLQMTVGKPGYAAAVAIGEAKLQTPTSGDYTTASGFVPVYCNVTFDRPFREQAGLGANLDGIHPEDNYANNWSGMTVEVVPAADPLPDLAISTPFRAVRQGSAFRLTATVKRLGVVPIPETETAFKAQVFLDSPDLDHRTVIAEETFTTALQAEWTFDKLWTPDGVAPGEHRLHFVVDPLNHMAATLDGAAAARLPAIGSRLSDRAGIAVRGDNVAAAPVSVAVHATDAEDYSDETDRIGVWSVAAGYRNFDLVEPEGDRNYWSTPEPKPLLLVFETPTGDLPLHDEPWFVDLDLAHVLPTEPDQPPVVEVERLTVALPANPRGEWGSKVAFRVSADGSSFFASAMHLAADFTNAPHSEADASTLDAEAAIADLAGAVTEVSEESNNMGSATVVIETPLPDLTVSFLDAPYNVSKGATVKFRVAVSSANVAVSDYHLLKLSVESSPAGEEPLAEFEQLVSGELVPGRPHVVEIDWSTGEPIDFSGAFVVEATVDAEGNRILESNESNNTATASGEAVADIELAVEAGATSVPWNGLVPLEMEVVSNRGTFGALSLEIFADGAQPDDEPIAMLDLAGNTPVQLTGTKTVSRGWNAEGFSAGSYVARGTVRTPASGQGPFAHLRAYSQPFSIEPDLVASVIVTTDKAAYECGDAMRISGELRNLSRNYSFAALDATVRVKDSADAVLFERTTTLDGLGLHERRTVQFVWPEIESRDAELVVEIAVSEIGGEGFQADDTAEVVVCPLDSVGATPTWMAAGGSPSILYTTAPSVAIQLSADDPVDAASALVMFSEAGFPLASGVPSRNRFANAACELEDSGLPGFWRGGSEPQQVVPVSDAAQRRSGARSVRIEGVSGSWSATRGSVASELDDAIAVRPNHRYVLSFWAMRDATASAVEVSVVESDATGVLDERVVALVEPSSSEWKRHQAAFRAGSGTTKVAFRFRIVRAASSATLWMDDFQFEAGNSSTRWMPDRTPDSESLNLLANPALAVDEGRDWSVLMSSLDESCNTAADGLPDGWIVSGTGVSMDSESDPPAAPARFGVSSVVSIAAGEHVALRQELLPAAEKTNRTFSVHARRIGGAADIRLAVRQYNADFALLPLASKDATYSLGTEWSRPTLSVPIDTQTAWMAVEVVRPANAGAVVELAAAQLEARSSATPWHGWVPFASGMDPYSVSTPASDGHRRMYVNYLSETTEPAERPASNLLRDAGDRSFANRASVSPSYSGTIFAGSATNSADVSGLFDGSSNTGLLVGQNYGRVRVEWTLPHSPTLDELRFDVQGEPGTSTLWELSGADEKGVWNSVATGTLASGRTEIHALAASWRHYRFDVRPGKGTDFLLASLEGIGFDADRHDRLVYDTTPPTGSILSPLDDSRICDATAALVVELADSLSGVAAAQYKLVPEGANEAEIDPVALEVSEGGFVEATIALDDVPHGTATIKVSAVDYAGNAMSFPDVEVIVDRQAPVLSNQLVDNVTLGNGQWYRRDHEAVVRVEIALDSLGTETLAKENFAADLTDFGLGRGVVPSRYEHPFVEWDIVGAQPRRIAGTLAVPILAWDDCGNMADEVVAAIVIDEIPPIAQIVPLLDDASATPVVTLAGFADDNVDGELRGIAVEFEDSMFEAAADDAPFDSSSEDWSVEIDTQGDGLYCVVATARDAAGNESINPALYCFEVVSGQLRAPRVAIRNMTWSDQMFARSEDTLVVEARFANGDVTGDGVEADLTELGSDAGLMPDDIFAVPYHWTLDPFQAPGADGQASVSVVGRHIGGEMTPTGTASILIDNTPPTVDLVDAPPALGDGTDLVFAGSIGDEAPGLLASVRYRVVRHEDISEAIGWTDMPCDPVVDGSQATTEFDLDLAAAALADGSYTFELEAYDRAGWLQGAGITRLDFTIDTGPPVIVAQIELKTSQGSWTDSRFIRDGAEARLLARIQDASLDTNSIVADLTGLTSNPADTAVAPDDIRGEYAEWLFETGGRVIDLDPADGDVVATIEAADQVDPPHVGTGQAEIVADNTPPEIESLLMGTSFTGDPAITGIVPIRGVAEDVVPGEVRYVEFAVFGIDEFEVETQIGGWQALPGVRQETRVVYSGNVIIADDGDFLIRTRAIDAAGNVSAPFGDPLEVTVDPELRWFVKFASLMDMDKRRTDRTRDTHTVQLTAHADTTLVPESGFDLGLIKADLSPFGLGSSVSPTSVELGIFTWDSFVVDTDLFNGPMSVAVTSTAVEYAGRQAVATIDVDNTPPLPQLTNVSEVIAFATSTPVLEGIIFEEADRVQLMTLAFGEWDAEIVEVDYPTEEEPDDYPFEWTPEEPLADGAYPVVMNAQDFIGNASGPVEETIWIDTIAPLATVAPVDTRPTNQTTVAFAGVLSDIGGSGVAAGLYRRDSETEWTEFATTGDREQKTYEISVTFEHEPGTTVEHVLHVVAVDYAGNQTAVPASAVVLIDQTPPEIVLAATLPLISTDLLPLTGSASDEAGGSGVEFVRLLVTTNVSPEPETLDAYGRVTEIRWPEAVEFDSMASFGHSANHEFEVWAVDAAGNESVPRVGRNLAVDIKAPEFVIVVPGTALSGREAEIEFSGSDDFSDVEQGTVEVRLGGETEDFAVSNSHESGDTNATGYHYTHMIDTWDYVDGPNEFVVRGEDIWDNGWVNRPNEANPAVATIQIDNELPPQAPTGLTAAYVSYTQVRLTWNKNTEPDLEGYRMYRREYTSSSAEMDEQTDRIHASTTITNAGIDPWNTFDDEVCTGCNAGSVGNDPGKWEYALRAYDHASNLSDFSAHAVPLEPAAPSELRAIGRNHAVDLTWKPVSEGFVAGYKVYRKTTGSFAEVASVSGATTSAWTDEYLDHPGNTTELTNDILYYYEVRAVDGAGNTSDPSNIADAMPSTEITERSAALVVFENAHTLGGNDLDYNDFGAVVRSVVTVEADGNGVKWVKSIALTIDGFIHTQSVSDCDLYIGIRDLVGTATYTISAVDSLGNPRVPVTPGIPTSGTGSYSWSSSSHLRIFYDNHSDELAGSSVPGASPPRSYTNNEIADWGTVTLTLDLPTPYANKLEDLDKVPYDLYLHNRVPSSGTTQAWIHIYDREMIEYEDELLNVQENTDFPELAGASVPGGLVIPDIHWRAPSEHRFEYAYPLFDDFIKTIRSGELVHTDWYLYPAAGETLDMPAIP